jgi:hypothetical protein
MKLNTKKTLLAIALASAVSGAQAASVNLTGGSFPYDLGVNPTDDNIYSVTHEVESFFDVFTFSLTTASDTISSAVALLFPGLNGDGSSYEINNGTLSLFSDPDGDGAAGANVQLASTTFGDSTGVLTFNNAATGSYYWAVAGDAVGSNGGVYLYSANTAAVVPEPETYAMMLAGLGLIGFIGRRRLAKGASELFPQGGSGLNFA